MMFMSGYIDVVISAHAIIVIMDGPIHLIISIDLLSAESHVN